MELADELKASLKQHLGWHKPRITCFVYLLLALLRVRRMDLTHIAVAMEGASLISSRYRRLQRFFAHVRFDYDAFAKLIVHCFGFDHYYLTLDRTNWKWGKHDLNLLVLAIVYKGVAVPVYWLVLNKQGNSNQRERIALLKRFIRQFGSTGIKAVLGDREFVGQQWWQWLTEHRIPFVMRMKHNQNFRHPKGKQRPVKQLFCALSCGQSKVLRKTRMISGQQIWLSALRLDSGEFLILASNFKQSDPFSIYAKRWEIESLFQALKGRGFHMESTHLTRYFRIKKMMAVLALAFVWAHKIGEWRDQQKPLKIKNHGRLEHSFFRYGLDYLGDQLHRRAQDAKEIVRLVLLLMIPWSIFEQLEPSLQRRN